MVIHHDVTETDIIQQGVRAYIYTCTLNMHEKKHKLQRVHTLYIYTLLRHLHIHDNYLSAISIANIVLFTSVHIYKTHIVHTVCSFQSTSLVNRRHAKTAVSCSTFASQFQMMHYILQMALHVCSHPQPSTHSLKRH